MFVCLETFNIYKEYLKRLTHLMIPEKVVKFLKPFLLKIVFWTREGYCQTILLTWMCKLLDFFCSFFLHFLLPSYFMKFGTLWLTLWQMSKHVKLKLPLIKFFLSLNFSNLNIECLKTLSISFPRIH